MGTAVTPARLTGTADVYKALPGATYRGGEEAGGLLYIPKANGKPVSRHGPGVKTTLSGGPY